MQGAFRRIRWLIGFLLFLVVLSMAAYGVTGLRSGEASVFGLVGIFALVVTVVMWARERRSRD